MKLSKLSINNHLVKLDSHYDVVCCSYFFTISFSAISHKSDSFMSSFKWNYSFGDV